MHVSSFIFDIITEVDPYVGRLVSHKYGHSVPFGQAQAYGGAGHLIRHPRNTVPGVALPLEDEHGIVSPSFHLLVPEI